MGRASQLLLGAVIDFLVDVKKANLMHGWQFCNQVDDGGYSINGEGKGRVVRVVCTEQEPTKGTKSSLILERNTHDPRPFRVFSVFFGLFILPRGPRAISLLDALINWSVHSAWCTLHMTALLIPMLSVLFHTITDAAGRCCCCAVVLLSCDV